MGDMSVEPSMEDILSSIKRIIAEEGDGAAAARPRRAPRPAAASPAPTAAPLRRAPVDPRDVLELSNPVIDDDQDGPDPRGRADETPGAEPILSESAAQASRGSLDALSRIIVKPTITPDPAAPETLEGMVREMLRPMLRDWLDAKLPGMVEEMVAREISRITQGR